jgi:hypothetical protein
MPGLDHIDDFALSRRFGLLPTLPAIVLLAACSSGQAQPSPLFAAGDTRLSAAEQGAVHAAFAEWFPVSSDGLRFEDENCGDIPARAEVVDLNGDGSYEVFIYWGNACTSGGTGSSLSLFTKDSSGGYRDQLGFPAAGYTTLPARNDGYPDLQFGGPGFCFAVWSWNGNNYEFKCNSPQEEGGCQLTGTVCQTN